MKVELHSHTRHSRDCLLQYDTIIAVCRRRHIGALAVTDHNEIEGAFEMRRRAPFPVIVGEEVFTQQGEVIGLFLREFQPDGVSVGPHEDHTRVSRLGSMALRLQPGLDLLVWYRLRSPAGVVQRQNISFPS